MNLRRLHQAFHAALAAALVLIAANPAQARQVDYQYDALNRLVAVIDAQGTTSFEYDAVGNRTAVDYPNGLRTEYGYDARDRLIEQTSEDAAGNLIAHYRYTLDETGQRIRLEEPHSGRTADWSYDELGRLTEEAVTDPSGGYTTSWTYDQVGNRLTQTEAGQTTGYTYDDNDRLLEEADATGITTYTYDANGNLTHQSGPQGSAGYGYDQENRLVSATTAAGSLAYTYDADGIRQSKTENGLETRYLVDPNQAYAQVLAEYDSFDNEIAAYTRTDHHLIGQDRAGSLRYYHQDGLGSTRLLTDGLGSLTDSYDYAAFGELDLVAGTTENEFLFTGEQYDPALELYYLRARWMDPGVGRFTQQDEHPGICKIPLTKNKYIYAIGNPVYYNDPSGYIIGIASLSINNFGVYGARSGQAYQRHKQITGSICRAASLVGKATHAHHVIPQFSGGKKKSGFTVNIEVDLHRKLHSLTTMALMINRLPIPNTKKYRGGFASGDISRKETYTVMKNVIKFVDANCLRVPGYQPLMPNFKNILKFMELAF